MNEMEYSAIIQKIEEDFVVTIPNHICEKLDITEGSVVMIDHFLCRGEAGIRIKLKT